MFSAAWRCSPPPGKVIEIVAVALSEEHSFVLEGGRTTKAGGYGLNTTGQPHSAMIGRDTTSLIVYSGEPDEIRSLEVVDLAEAG